MAYDKARRDEIRDMSVADLIHTMLLNFDPHMADGELGGVFLQNQDYFWAHERLEELLPAAPRGE